MSSQARFVVYGGSENHGFDAKVLEGVNQATGLGLRFSHIWHETHPDGEPGFLLEDYERIRGRHAIVFSCPVTYELESELRDLITGCKLQYGAASVTVVLSYLRYRRQDRAEVEAEITRLRWFIHDLKKWGADRLVVCEPHSEENTRKHCREFGLELHISDPTKQFAEALTHLQQTCGVEETKIYSPDFGGIGRALRLSYATGWTVVVTPKRRIYGDSIESDAAFDDGAFLERVRETYGPDAPISCDVRELKGRHVIMREDELSTGTTAVLTAMKLRSNGVSSVRFLATHPVCTRGWKMKFFPSHGESPFDEIWLGNTRSRGEGQTTYKGSTGGRIKTVEVEPAVAETLAPLLLGIQDWNQPS